MQGGLRPGARCRPTVAAWKLRWRRASHRPLLRVRLPERRSSLEYPCATGIQEFPSWNRDFSRCIPAAECSEIDAVTMIDNKIVLPESQLPRSWYNVVAELPFDVPRPLHPIEDRGVEIEDYDWLWPRECLRIELQEGEYGTDAWIEIPQFISDVYRRYRPSPLVRARALESYLGDACRDLLQARRPESCGQSQVQHRIGSGVLRRARRRLSDSQHGHRYGSRSVGSGFGDGVRDAGARLLCVHDPQEL